MGTGRKFAKAPKTRPKKNAGDRRRREKTQRRRLIALGVPEETVRRLTSKDVRQRVARSGPVKQAD